MGKWISRHRRSSYMRKSAGRDRRYNSAKDHDENPRIDCTPGFPKLAPSTHDGVVSALAVNEGRYCLSGNKDGVVLYQDLQTGNVLNKWHGHDREVTGVKIPPAGDVMLSSSRDKTVRIWKHGCKEECGRLEGHTLGVSAVDCDKNCTQIVSGSRDNSVILWDAETLDIISNSKISRNLVTDVCWAADLNIIAQTAEDKMLKLWDPNNLEVVHTFSPQGQIQTCCTIFENYCLTSNNGFGGNGCEICLWDLRERKLVQTFRGHTETVSCCRFLPRGRGFVSCSHDGTVKLWQPPRNEQAVSQCEQQLSVSLNSGTLTSLAVVDNGNIICSSFDGGVKPVSIRGKSQTL